MNHRNPLLNDNDPRKIVRRTDPGTSREAAVAHTVSGKRASNKLLILQRIQQLPDATCRELAKGMPLDSYEVTKRVSELHESGKVMPTGARVCSVSGHRARTWRIVL